jgi:hypothetical protein
LVIKTLDPDQYGIQLKMLDPDPDQMRKVADPHHFYADLDLAFNEMRIWILLLIIMMRTCEH